MKEPPAMSANFSVLRSVSDDVARGSYLEIAAVSLPQNPFHPGEMLLEEFLVPGKMTQAALAQKLGGRGRA